MMAEDFLKIKKGFFVDVGCHQPLLNNNTYILIQKRVARNKR